MINDHYFLWTLGFPGPQLCYQLIESQAINIQTNKQFVNLDIVADASGIVAFDAKICGRTPQW